ncbi:MAG: hypothetical protein Q4E33_05525 [Erysipelotrichaceae bacterium]|nr:hypothetical protein [Erysipelotrichaceae bacterium]
MANKRQQYQTQFNKDHYRSFIIRIPKEKKAALIKQIEKQPNYNQYIIKLVEKDKWQK